MWLFSALLLAAQGEPTGDVHWPQFRGPGARGIARGHQTPTEWDVAAGKNVVWVTPIPGLAHSSPIVWGERVFVMTAARWEGESELSSLYGSPGYGAGDPVADEGPHAFLVMCLDKASGEVLWEQVAHSGTPKVKRHPKATHANSTPATDGKHVVAFFGSEGLYCYDFEGELLWKKDLGVLDAGAPGMRDYQWGFAASPIIHAGRVVAQCDVQDQSFLAVFDVETGAELWRTARDEDPTWSTPAIVPAAGERPAQIVCNGYKHIGAYTFDAGKEVWKLSGGGDVPVPTPLVVGDMIFITSAHGRMQPIYAIRADAKGELDIDPEKCAAMAWSHPRRGIYMQTPLVYEGLAYFCADGGALACYDAETGEEHYRERLGSGDAGFSGSAVAAGGKLYFTAENGEVHVVGPGKKLETLAVNDLGETCLSTPAVSEGRLFFRTRSQLVAVGELP